MVANQLADSSQVLPYEILFPASIAPLGYSTYFIADSSSADEKL
jgi:hypothetical protein